MKAWNEKRLADFFRLNFDSSTCKKTIKDETMSVIDSNGETVNFIIKDNRIYSPDTKQFYA